MYDIYVVPSLVFSPSRRVWPGDGQRRGYGCLALLGISLKSRSNPLVMYLKLCARGGNGSLVVPNHCSVA